MPFTLHPRLEKGSFELGRLNGCRILLKDNTLFPWLLVVPEVAEGIEDLHQLDAETHQKVTEAILMVSNFVSAHFSPDKLNVACIGNMVRQMHIHVVGRSEGDPAWPGVVWSHDGKEPYAEESVATIRSAWDAFNPS